MSHHDHHKFDPARLARLERPERHALMRPRDLLLAAGITEGMTVVDIGCGTGFFTLPAAELVGPTGRVLALDIAPAMLDFLRDRKPPPHVDVLPCDESTFPVADDTADLVVLSLVLHEAVDPHRFLADIARLLRPGGLVVGLEWKDQDEPRGPGRADRIDRSTTLSWLRQANFGDVSATDWSPSHYAFTARRPRSLA